MKNFILLITFLVLYGCAKSIISVDSSIVNDDLLSEYNIYTYYSLPKTVLKIKIPIAHNKLEEGLVSKAKEEINIYEILECRYGWKPVEPPKHNYSIDKKIAFEALTLPDPKKRYAIAYKNSEMINQTLNATLTKDGLIQSGEFAQESKAFDVAVKAMEILGPLIESISPLGKTRMTDDPQSKLCSYENVKSPRIKNLLKEVDELLETRYELILNPTNSVDNPEIIKFHLGEVDKQLLAIKHTLLGSISKKIHYVTILVDPPRHFEELALLEIDPKMGIIKNEKMEWKYPSEDLITNKGTNTTIKLKLLARKLIEPGVVRGPEVNLVPSENEETVNQELNTNVFMYYNIPAKYELKLVVDDKPLKSYASKKDKEGSDEYQIFFPQLGKVAFLHKGFKEASVTYYEDTGGLKSAKISKSADIDADKLESLYSAIDSVYSTIQNIRAKDKAGEDEVDQSITEEFNEQVIKIIFEGENPMSNDQ